MREEELLKKDCGLFPIHINGVKIFDRLGLPPAATLPFVLLFGDKNPQTITIRHETIHYRQYRELLFLGFLPLYFLHIISAFLYFKIKYRGASLNNTEILDITYHANPFEREAYENQHDSNYLKNRKRFAWLSFVKDSFSNNF